MDDGKRMAAASACRGWPVRRTWSPPGIQSIPQHHGVGRRELREPGGVTVYGPCYCCCHREHSDLSHRVCLQGHCELQAKQRAVGPGCWPG